MLERGVRYRFGQRIRVVTGTGNSERLADVRWKYDRGEVDEFL